MNHYQMISRECIHLAGIDHIKGEDPMHRAGRVAQATGGNMRDDENLITYFDRMADEMVNDAMDRIEKDLVGTKFRKLYFKGKDNE